MFVFDIVDKKYLPEILSIFEKHGQGVIELFDWYNSKISDVDDQWEELDKYLQPEDVYIMLMDYATRRVDYYKVEMSSVWDNDEVEKWLRKNTDYNPSWCHFIAWNEPIGFYNHTKED